MTTPADRNKVLVGVDMFDVSPVEKQPMEQAITKMAINKAMKDGQPMQNTYYFNNQ